MKARTLADLNKSIMRTDEYKQGFLDACNLIDNLYSGSTTHKFLLGDCVLNKCNMLAKGKRPRVNPKRIDSLYKVS